MSKRETIRLLIAEDERPLRALLFEELQDQDREIKTAANGLEALDLLKKEPFDLLITDVRMPGMSGIELLKEAKRLNPKILVIIITGYATLESAIQALKEGAYDYIRKPFSLEELKVSVDNACTRIILERENERLLEKLKEAYSRLRELSERAQKVVQTSKAEHILDELERLARLRQEGFLAEEEFETLKEILLGKMRKDHA